MKINMQVGRTSARSMKFLTLALVLPATLLCQTNPVVRFQTNLGDIDVELYAEMRRRRRLLTFSAT